MIPGLLVSKTAVPVEPVGVVSPEKASDPDAAGFETELEAEPEPPVAEEPWLPLVPVPDSLPGEVRQRLLKAEEGPALLPGAIDADMAATLSEPPPEAASSAGTLQLAIAPSSQDRSGPPVPAGKTAADGEPDVAAVTAPVGQLPASAAAMLPPLAEEPLESAPPSDTRRASGLDGAVQRAADALRPNPAAMTAALAPADLSSSEPQVASDLPQDQPLVDERGLARGLQSVPLTGAVEGAVRDALSRSEGVTRTGALVALVAPPSGRDPARAGTAEDALVAPYPSDRRGDLSGQRPYAVQGAGTLSMPDRPIALVDPELLRLAEAEVPPEGPSPLETLHSPSESRGGQGRGALPSVGAPSLPASLASTILGAVSSPTPGGVEVALSPAELGHMRIELAQDGDGLRIVLSAERPETLDLLRRNADQLMTEVLQAGFSGAEMSFGTWGGPSDRDRNAPQGHERSDPGPDTSPGPNLADGRFPILPAHHGGLNLRL